jgi:hypothetical protein
MDVDCQYIVVLILLGGFVPAAFAFMIWLYRNIPYIYRQVDIQSEEVKE